MGKWGIEGNCLRWSFDVDHALRALIKNVLKRLAPLSLNGSPEPRWPLAKPTSNVCPNTLSPSFLSLFTLPSSLFSMSALRFSVCKCWSALLLRFPRASLSRSCGCTIMSMCVCVWVCVVRVCVSECVLCVCVCMCLHLIGSCCLVYYSIICTDPISLGVFFFYKTKTMFIHFCFFYSRSKAPEIT